MQQVYGPITGFTISMCISLVTQVIKKLAPELSDRMTQILVLGVAVLFTVPFEIFSIWPDVTPIDCYNAFIYSFLGWFSALGIYHAYKVQFGSGQ